MPRGPVRIFALALFIVALGFFFYTSTDSAAVEDADISDHTITTSAKWRQGWSNYASRERWPLWRSAPKKPQRIASTIEKLPSNIVDGTEKDQQNALKVLKEEALEKEDITGLGSSGARLNEHNAELLSHDGISGKTGAAATKEGEEETETLKKPGQSGPPKTPDQVEGGDIARQLLNEEHKDMLHALDADVDEAPPPEKESPKSNRKPTKSSHATGNRLSKTLVIGKPEDKAADWIKQEFSDFKTVVYDISPSTSSQSGASLMMPLRGGAALAFLTYITDNYKTLSDVTLFISAMPLQTTQKNRLFDGEKDYKAELSELAPMLHTMNTSYIQENGYTSLRCEHLPGCTSQTIIKPSATWVFAQPWHHEIHAVWRALFPADDEIPEQISSPWVGQFAVSKEQVRIRPLSDYQKMRTWVQGSRTEEGMLQRVMTSLWHVVFSKPPVDCPAERQCVCEFYGKCDADDEKAAQASDGKAVDEAGKVLRQPPAEA